MADLEATQVYHDRNDHSLLILWKGELRACFHPGPGYGHFDISGLTPADMHALADSIHEAATEAGKYYEK